MAVPYKPGQGPSAVSLLANPAMGGGSASTPIDRSGAAGSGGDKMTGAIASQLLGIANDSGTHTVGHAGYTISKAADRAAARGRFDGYKADAKKAAKRAAKVIRNRNDNIIDSYANAGDHISKRADNIMNSAIKQMGKRDTAYAETADDLGLTAAVPEQSRADTVAALLAGNTQSQALAWKGFDQTQGRRERERNNGSADAVINTGLKQRVSLNGLLENVLAGLQDQSVASTLRTVSDTSQSQRLQALTGLRYLNKDTQSNSLAQQKLLAQVTQGPSTSTTRQYGSGGQLLGSSSTTRSR